MSWGVNSFRDFREISYLSGNDIFRQLTRWLSKKTLPLGHRCHANEDVIQRTRLFQSKQLTFVRCCCKHYYYLSVQKCSTNKIKHIKMKTKNKALYIWRKDSKKQKQKRNKVKNCFLLCALNDICRRPSRIFLVKALLLGHRWHTNEIILQRTRLFQSTQLTFVRCCKAATTESFFHQTTSSATNEITFQENAAIRTPLRHKRRCYTTNEIVPKQTAYLG